MDDLTIGECEDIALDFRGQPVPVALRIEAFNIFQSSMSLFESVSQESPPSYIMVVHIISHDTRVFIQHVLM